ncbi:hypothetical protein LUZ60_017308 [Juncus effusus]|nr:hypothetical protein LUZ60_017308 [Juncus effusus]
METVPTKEEFLKQFGNCYGYPNGPRSVDEIRSSEFKRLQGTVYLDHAGSTLYSEKQMEEITKDLTSNIYGNPHSQNDSSMASSDIITTARHQVLRYFNASAKEYKCVFTSGTTGALKLVGEFFPWNKESIYAYSLENHNSVLGIREYALNKGASVLAVDIEKNEGQNAKIESDEFSVQIVKRAVQKRGESNSSQNAQNEAYNLFAFPSECNFSGEKFPLSIVDSIKKDGSKVLSHTQNNRGKWMVLIDAAKGSATDPPDLGKYKADFVVFSFYKIFGYPTGLGALLVRNDAAHLLKKTYFSGGTVTASISDIDFVKRREKIEELFEDGTSNFLAISAISHGFKIINDLSIHSISRHTNSLAEFTRGKMLNLKHGNDKQVCKIYGGNFKMGPTIAFNLKREDGSWFGYREVEKLASLSNIHLRTGCFCNPGACAKHLGLSHSDLISNFEAGHVCWDDNDVINGKPTGAVRVSFGYMSTFEDADKFLKFLEESFVSKTQSYENGSIQNLKALELPGVIKLKSVTIYPIKSCSGFDVQSWPLGSIGLKYDREWLLKGPNGEILTQKKVPEMSSIHTQIDLQKGILHLKSPKLKEKLEISLLNNNSSYLNEEMDVYGYRYEVESYTETVNKWFEKAIGRTCTLVRCTSSKYRSYKSHTIGHTGFCRENRSQVSFANEAQLLLVSEDSLFDLNDRLNSRQVASVDWTRFRPNLVISGSKPYSEDSWSGIQIGKSRFTSLGGCNRCEMINLDRTSELVRKSKEPLSTLASYRRYKGKILFGILLRYEDDPTGEETGERWLHVGQEVYTLN